MTWRYNTANDTAWLNTPQEYLHEIREYLINAVDKFWDWLNDYPIIKTFAWISLIMFFLFRLLNKK